MLKEMLETILLEMNTSELTHSFYFDNAICISFEIGTGDVFEDEKQRKFHLCNQYVKDALHRTMHLYHEAVKQPSILVWQIYSKNEKQEHAILRKFKRDIWSKAPHEVYRKNVIIGENFLKTVCIWDLNRCQCPIKKLWTELIKADFAGFKELISAVYVIDMQSKLIFHLYDDRGADIAAVTPDTLIPISKQYKNWIHESKGLDME